MKDVITNTQILENIILPDGYDYPGQIESIGEEGTRCRRAVSFLIALMEHKGLLSKEELEAIKSYIRWERI